MIFEIYSLPLGPSAAALREIVGRWTNESAETCGELARFGRELTTRPHSSNTNLPTSLLAFFAPHAVVLMLDGAGKLTILLHATGCADSEH